MKLIARGAFTKCYRSGNKAILHSSDPAKECAALGWGSSSPLFPKIRRIKDGIYEMEFYPKVKSIKDNLTPNQYKIYRKLREIKVTFDGDNYRYLNSLRAAFNKLPKKVAVALNGQLDGLENFGADIRFEISPRNVAVKNKKLILLDCFFFASKLREVRG